MWFSFPCLCLSEVIEMIIFKQELVTVWSQEPGFVERWAAVLGPSAALEEVSRWQTEEPSVLTCIRLKTWCIESSASLVSCGSPWFLCCQVLQLQLLEGNSDLIRTVSHHFKYMNVKIPKLCNSKTPSPSILHGHCLSVYVGLLFEAVHASGLATSHPGKPAESSVHSHRCTRAADPRRARLGLAALLHMLLLTIRGCFSQILLVLSFDSQRQKGTVLLPKIPSPLYSMKKLEVLKIARKI